ncbi:MAG: LamG-like jellyroll fold domain-containing protein [Vicingaceae bacterium]
MNQSVKRFWLGLCFSIFCLAGTFANTNEFCQPQKLRSLTINESFDTLSFQIVHQRTEIGALDSAKLQFFFQNGNQADTALFYDQEAQNLTIGTNFTPVSLDGISYLVRRIDSSYTMTRGSGWFTNNITIIQTVYEFKLYDLAPSALSADFEIRLSGKVKADQNASTYNFGTSGCAISEIIDGQLFNYESEKVSYPKSEFCEVNYLNDFFVNDSYDTLFLDFINAHQTVGHFDSLKLKLAFFNGLAFDTIEFYNHQQALTFSNANSLNALSNSTSRNGLSYLFGNNEQSTVVYTVDDNDYQINQENLYFAFHNLPDTAFYYPFEVFYEGQVVSDSGNVFGLQSCPIPQQSERIEAKPNEYCNFQHLDSISIDVSNRRILVSYIKSIEGIGHLTNEDLYLRFATFNGNYNDYNLYKSSFHTNYNFNQGAANAETKSVASWNLKIWKDTIPNFPIKDRKGNFHYGTATRYFFEMYTLQQQTFEFDIEAKLSAQSNAIPNPAFNIGDCAISSPGLAYQSLRIDATDNEFCAFDKNLSLFRAGSNLNFSIDYSMDGIGEFSDLYLDLVSFNGSRYDTVRFYDSDAQNIFLNTNYTYNGIDYSVSPSNFNRTIASNSSNSIKNANVRRWNFSISNLSAIQLNYNLKVIVAGNIIPIQIFEPGFSKGLCAHQDTIHNQAVNYSVVEAPAETNELCLSNPIISNNVDFNQGIFSFDLIRELNGVGSYDDLLLEVKFFDGHAFDSVQFFKKNSQGIDYSNLNSPLSYNGIDYQIAQSTVNTSFTPIYHKNSPLPNNALGSLNGNKLSFQLTNLPAMAFSKDITIKVKADVNATYNSGYGTEECAYEHQKSFMTLGTNFGGPEIAQSFPGSASVDTYCRRVLYNIGSANTYQINLPNNFEYFVYRDDSLVSVQSAWAYNDQNVEPFVNYIYKSKTGWKFPNNRYGGNATNYQNRYLFSPRSNGVLGRAVGPIGSATNVYANTANCDGDIRIIWNYTGSGNPNQFVVERSLDSNFTSYSSFAVNASSRSFTDAASQVGVSYYYRIKAELSCPGQTNGGVFSPYSSTLKVVGIGPPPTPIMNSIAVDTNAGTITVRWTDNSELEDFYRVVRQSNVGQVNFDIPANSEVYVDSSVQACLTYTYRVSAVNNQCATNGVISDTSLTAYVPPKLSETFTTNDELKASDGAFGDKIELRWTFSNNLVEDWIILRTELSTGQTTQVGTVDGAVKFYSDNTALANTIYEYKIYGQTTCGTATSFTDTIQDNGFRLAFGTISGQVAVSGGTPVSGVKIKATAASGTTGSSLYFNGTSSEVTVPHNSSFGSNSPTFRFAVSAFVRPTLLNGTQTIISKKTGSNGFALRLKEDSLQLQWGFTTYTATAPQIRLNQWFHVAAVRENNAVVLYIDGNEVLRDSEFAAYPNTASLSIGAENGSNYFTGSIDEVRFYDRPLTANEIAETYGVYIDPSTPNLKGYWRFDAAFGNLAYDYSKTINGQNENHGTILGGAWSALKVPETLLSAGAITKADGTYFIPFLPYLGNGDNFILTPVLGTHQFSPSTKSVFVSNSNPNISGVDFIDNSSFTLSGKVNFVGTNCPSKDVLIAVDGQVVVKNGETVKTDGNGDFSVDVPIGNHFISLQKNNHHFVEERFPSSGLHDFQANLHLSMPFEDSTLMKIVGRVAGGGEQAQTLPNFGYGKNNIGMAEITFKSQLQNGCITKVVSTDSINGEYEVYLPPLKYELPDFSLKNNGAIDFENNALIDLSNAPIAQQVLDTVNQDSTSFHLRRDFIYYAEPILDVTDENGGRNYGSDTIAFEDNGIRTQIPTAGLGLAYDVFEENENYSWEIHAFEIYTNYDSVVSVTDSVPVSQAEITIQNNLATESQSRFRIEEEDGFSGTLPYSFTGGQANLAVDNNFPSYSFTKTADITLKTANHLVEWKPNSTDPQSQSFRGITFGGKANGTDFVTSGPSLVTMVLRDPPGSESYTEWLEGTTVTNSTTITSTSGVDAFLQNKLLMGTKFTTGVGYEVTTDFENSRGLAVSTKREVAKDNEVIETNTVETTISTSNTIEFVGGGADLFYGKAFNIKYGLADVVRLTDTANCATLDCFGDTLYHNWKAYRIAKAVTMFVIPQADSTDFLYTASTIEKSIIPNLIALRNQYLRNTTKYTSHLAPTDPNYGRSNDDTLFASLPNQTPDYLSNTVEDSIGPSYTFHGYGTRIDTSSGSPVSIATGVDSVWMINQQVRLWIQTLAENEREKLTVSNTNFDSQKSLGGSKLSVAQTTTVTETKTKEFHLNLSAGFFGEIGTKIGGFGFNKQRGLTIKQESNERTSTAIATTNTFTYHLEDGGSFDQFSTKVYKSTEGFGPIFILDGGVSSCPHEGTELSKYHNPGSPMNIGTIPLDQPEIGVDNPSINNIPADGLGVFNLSLINNGPQNVIYGLKVLESTNPNGAILKIDGLSPNREFAIAAGAAGNNNTVRKTLTIAKGAGHITYDSIALVLHSLCQYSFGTANYVDIADTVYVSAQFLPSCTDLKISAPQDQFVVNNSFNNKVEVEVSDYDINYDGLEKIRLQYKPSSQSNWINLATEWFKDTAGIGNHPDPQLLPNSQAFFEYDFDLTQLIDQNYQLRAVTTCDIIGAPDKEEFSNIVEGKVDRVNPRVFGSPSPADGVLDPNDDISIRFNEPIEQGSLNSSNFSLSGVVNGAPLNHATHLEFDGQRDFVEIANGFDFHDEDFTIEFWLKRRSFGSPQTIFYQGSDKNQSIHLQFLASDHLKVSIERVSRSTSWKIQDTLWHHISVAVDKQSNVLDVVDRSLNGKQVYTSTNIINSNYSVAGKTYLGKMQEVNGNAAAFFNGYLHDVRVWDGKRSDAELALNKDKKLLGNEAGLLAYWPFDEGRDSLAADLARSRNALVKANWRFSPSSFSAKFDGIDDHLMLDSAGIIPINAEMDFTLEFWFKTAGGKRMSFLSNGSGRQKSNDINENGWDIALLPDNSIHVYHDSLDFVATTQNFADNNWHHFALVLNRRANLTAFVDGVEQGTRSAVDLNGFSASKLAIGGRYATQGTTLQDTVEHYFEGYLDEVRLWNQSQSRELIDFNRFNRLKGDEVGLQLYYPFDRYSQINGDPNLQASFDDATFRKLNPTLKNGILSSIESPAIAIQRQTKQIPVSWVVNSDEIVITPLEPSENIENVTLTMSVQGIKDLSGNQLQSPKSWIAYINKNQVKWQDLEKNLQKEVNDQLQFDAKIVNQGGELKAYSISNLPAWLTASRTSGNIGPLSSETITFTVNQGINIGEYTADILLTTDFNYAEKLAINLSVQKTPPDFSFDAGKYAKSMSVIGQIAINGNVSVNGNDQLIAFANGEIRGATSLQYEAQIDKYLAFLNVYSNQNDSIYFKVWNASKGVLHEEVTPSLTFQENSLVGSLANPQVFNATDRLNLPIVFRKGWNWLSFPLKDEKMSDLRNFFEGVHFSKGDQIKTRGQNAFSTYDSTAQEWGSSSLTRNGLDNRKSYLLYVAKADTFYHRGLEQKADTITLNVVEGWNRIGFISTKNLSINTALANYNASQGDLIKSQQAFAVYLPSIGWIGSLTTLEPTKGYLLQSQNTTSFAYPTAGLFRLKSAASQKLITENIPSNWSLKPHDFEASTSLIVEIESCDEIQLDSNWAIAAFKNDTLRGWSQLKEVEQNGLHFLTVYGSGSEKFSFKYINVNTKEAFEIMQKVNFEKNKVQGEILNPLHFTLLDTLDCNRFKTEALNGIHQFEEVVFPNPFKEKFTLNLPREFQNECRLEIWDEFGKLLLEKQLMDQQEITITSGETNNWSAGVYFLKLSKSDKIEEYKIIKMK